MTETAGGVEARWLLGHARGLLTRADDTTAGRWPRAAALLARQALEVRLDEVCGARDVALGSCRSARAQLLCLRWLIDRRLALTVEQTWVALSGACHHHAYDLPPTADELTAWCDAVEAFLG
jgi:hypothetical protein